MAVNRWLAQTLIESLKRRGLLPTADETFAAADWYQLIDEETRSYVLPLLREVNEEFLHVRYDVDVAAGTDTYPLPPRCAAEALKIVLIDSSASGDFKPLDRIEPEQAYRHTVQGGSGPGAYYLQDDSIVLVPSPSVTGATLRFIHFNRPSQVVVGTAAAEITAINTATKACTLRLADISSATAPTGFSSSELYDFVKGTPGFRCLAIDQAATLATNVLTFTAELPERLAVGDFISLAGQTPVAQVPAEFHPLLAQRVAFLALDALSPRESAKAEGTLEKMEAKVRGMFEARVQAQPRFAHNFNAAGWGRSGRGWPR